MLRRHIQHLFCCLIIGLSVTARAQNAPLLKWKNSGNHTFPANLEKFVTGDEPEAAYGRYYQLVQFNATPNQNVINLLTSQGLRFLDYIPSHAYFVSFPVGYNRANLQAMNIRLVEDIPVFEKYRGDILSLPSDFLTKDGLAQTLITFHKDVPHDQALIFLATSGLEVAESNQFVNNAVVWLNPLDVYDLADNIIVKYVDALPVELQPEDNHSRALHRSLSINQYDPLGDKFDGSGVVIAVNDDGFVGPHIDFTGRTEQSDVAGDFTGTHGDMVAGIAGGAGNLDPRHEGMAKGSFMHIRQYSSSLPNTVSLHQNDTVMIFNSSYGNGCNDGYTGLCEQIDQEIRQNPSLLQVFSTGNSGTSNCGYGAGSGWGNITGGHKQAKNVIACANLDRDESLMNSSSRGPATDGRIKPDIAANGNDQISTDPNNEYSPGGGTSAASPSIMGCATQLYQAYKEFNGGNNPESGLIKASLLNSAEDFGNTGPDFEYGWGRVNTRRALDIIRNAQYLVDSVTNGATDNLSLNVPAGVKELRIMLYWMDREAAAAAAPALVNDLDLTVFDGSSTYQPWILDPTPNVANLTTPATNGADHLNNMEQVAIVDPVSGNYTITVDGFDVPFGPQKYYVVYTYLYDEITIVNPNGGEGLVPGETERLFWDAYDNTGSYTMEYSVDNGSNWTALGFTPGTDRWFDWTIPNDLTGRARFRISNGSNVDISDTTFSIIDVPQNIIFTQACASHLTISWDSVPGAYGYEVYLLGNKYMDSVGRTTQTFFQVPANPNLEQWVSVAAIPPDDTTMLGRRAIAVYFDGTGTFNCSFTDDVAGFSIDAPLQTQYCSADSIQVSVTISNYGQNTVSNFPIKYQLGAQPVVTETFSGTLAPGQAGSYTFNTQTAPSGYGLHDLDVWTEAVPDNDPTNDTLTLVIDYGANVVTTYPTTQDFEGFSTCGQGTNCEQEICPLGGGWRNQQNGTEDDIDWRVDINGTPSTGTGPDIDHTFGTTLGQYVYLEASGGCEGMIANLTSPCLDLTANGTATLSFWYHMYGSDMGSLHLDVFDGTGWVLDVMTAISGDQGDVWHNMQVNLDTYAGGVIQLRFRGITGTGYQSDMALDDINLLAEFAPISVDSGVAVALTAPENFGVEAMSAYLFPNPTTGNTTLRVQADHAHQAMIRVFDTQGKLVESRAVGLITGPNRVELNSTGYSAGIYMVSIVSETGSVTRKLVVR